MNYKESEKALNSIVSNYGEFIFRLGISHMIDVGIRNLTDEAIKHTCEELMKQDDSKMFMTNEFQCDIVKCAGEIAKIDHIHTLKYIGKNIKYNV